MYFVAKRASSKSFIAFDTVTNTNPVLAAGFPVCYLACYMGVTGIHVSQKEQLLGQVDRLVGSAVLHNAESLRKLLSYLAKRAIEHPGEPVKEYQIATEVFGRPADFDPQLDANIRVQVGRLRTKLIEYYTAEGVDDPVVVEIPKGSYHLEFHRRPSARPNHANHAVEAPVARPESPSRAADPWRIAAGFLAAAVAALLIALIWLTAFHKPGTPAVAASADPAPEPFRVFWKPFLSSPEDPWVIFSNAAFVGRPETGLRYYSGQRDSKDQIFDHYTGVGEVLAVHDLDHVFETFRRQLRVKRGSLFTLDDEQNNNLIFLGSPSENLTLTEIPGTQDFVFQRMKSGPRKGDLAIVNAHPEGNEPKYVLASPADSPLTDDYGVVALLPGFNAGHWTMILAGTTTFGTQGTVQYVCREDSVQQLLLRLSVSSSGEIKPFEALVHVKIEKGVPVGADLIALRERNQ
jgi:hypothetical protein